MSTAAHALSGVGRADSDSDLPVMAFVADDVTRQTLVRLASDLKWRDPLIRSAGVALAREELADTTVPTMLVIDLSESSDPLGDVNGLAEVCEPGTRVIALGTVNDVRLYRGLIDAGVSDYLVKPVSAADLGRAVSHAIAGGKTEAADGKRGRIHAVIGARGGVGASSVAVNLAWALSQEFKQRVMLVDFDLYFGTVALSLDVDPGNGFRDVLHNPSRIDPLFLERAAVRINDTLAILGTEEQLMGGSQWSADAFIPLLNELGKTFDHIVLDLPRTFAIQHPELVASATTTLIVSDLSLSAMRDALRLKILTRETAPQTRLRVVINHFRPPGKGDMPVAEFERSIDDKIACSLPFDPKGAARANSTGKPLIAVAHKSKGADALRKFSQGLVAAKVKPKKPGFTFARLFRS